MKKTLLLLFSCLALSFCCFSQDCPVLFNSAMDLFKKGDYENARARFAQVVEHCGNGGDYRGALSKIKECDEKLKAKLEVAKRDVIFGPKGGTETVRVSSGGASWSYGKVPEWLSLSKNKGQLVIKCEGNTSGEERNTDVILYSGEGSGKVTKKIHVVQNESVLSVSRTSLHFSESGSASYLIEVNSNDDWEIVISDGDWLSVVKSEGGVLASCSENPMAVERHCTFSIVTSNGEFVVIDVTQNKSKTILEVETPVRVAWNVGSYKIRITTNDPNWTYEVIGGSWCIVEKQNDQGLLLKIDNNETGYTRENVIRVTTAGGHEDIIVKQRSFGYGALYEDYFVQKGGTKRITKLSAGAYVLGSYGLRVSAFMVRWKVVEIDLLNLNTSMSKSFQLSWEPMVRGYLPLQSEGLCWTPYVGIGGCVSFIDKPLREGNKIEHSKVLLEAGTEFNPKLKGFDNLSMRVFVRIDGYFSIGVAFDLSEWK